MTENPFSVFSPESLNAKDVYSFFVEDKTQYRNVLAKFHTMVIGPRGTGKSMIFRYLEPDCQILHKKINKVADLDFYGAYVPVKDKSLDLTEFERLEVLQFSPRVMHEHILVSHICVHLAMSLSKNLPEEKLGEFWTDFLFKRLVSAGYNAESVLKSDEPSFQTLEIIFDEILTDTQLYIGRIGMEAEPSHYKGPLLSYDTFLRPFIRKLSALDFMPNGPIYLLFDDADHLNRTQTSLLNTWISNRSSEHLCIKLAVESLKYKTFNSISGRRIEAPHDYQVVKLNDVYTSNKDGYFKRVEDIVKKRFSHYGILSNPHEFFPEKPNQSSKIKEIEDTYRSRSDSNARGYRASDDAYRYSRPDYIRSLSGPSAKGEGSQKNASTYSYSGFNQLVQVSSGTIRYFLEAAADMYDLCEINSPSEAKEIPHSAQDKVLQYRANRILRGELVELENSEDEDTELIQQLANLINAMGGIFSARLKSNLSERRVFSMALSDIPDERLRTVLNKGVSLGYLQHSTIGNKDGLGRSDLYILTRRLAPAFTLDPTGFSGYQFITCDRLSYALKNPDKVVRDFEASFQREHIDNRQGSLFE